MILGKGMLASYFQDREDAILFCSGVSDSGISDDKEFVREQQLLESIPKDRCVVYTSTLSAAIGQTPYQCHKLRMEILVKQFPEHLIFRVGNLVGKNQRTCQFFPAMIQQIKNGYVKIKQCRRDLLGTWDFAQIVNEMLDSNDRGLYRVCSNDPPWVLDIVAELEKNLGVECVKDVLPCDEPFVLEPDLISGGSSYYMDVIKRYFAW